MKLVGGLLKGCRGEISGVIKVEGLLVGGLLKGGISGVVKFSCILQQKKKKKGLSHFSGFFEI